MSDAVGPMSPERMLVILTGPVGGGKSTTALALAERFRARRQTVAVIDLDVIYCMARQVGGGRVLFPGRTRCTVRPSGHAR